MSPRKTQNHEPESAGQAEESAGLAGAGPRSRRLRYEHLPVVVIAGRPNVGKSTLYNRLLHKRRAITDPTPGVTRDPVDSLWEIRSAEKRALLVDTGGFKLDREGLDGLVVEKSLESLQRADLILFLVDAAHVTPEDEEFAQLLRRWAGKLLLVVNKADSPERDPLVWGHARWGFDPVIFVSAEHGRNIDVLEEAVVSRLDFSRVVEIEEGREPIRLAIMGKPNTGKSTLLNRLVGEEKSIVSEVAGTTRDVLEARFAFKGRQFIVLDTAGIRRKKKVTDAVEYYSVNRAIRVVDDCDVVVLMIDAAEGLTEQDKKIAAFASEKGRGLVFALNKWDTMPDLKNAFEASRDKLRYFFGQMAWAPVLPLSAREGTGVDKLLNTVVTLHAELNRKIETSRLNKSLAQWMEATPPPVGARTRFKVRYAVQTSVNPQGFAIFVSRPEAVPDSYVSFLRNKIRSELGMDKIPVLLEVKASRASHASRRERVSADPASASRSVARAELDAKEAVAGGKAPGKAPAKTAGKASGKARATGRTASLAGSRGGKAADRGPSPRAKPRAPAGKGSKAPSRAGGTGAARPSKSELSTKAGSRVRGLKERRPR